MAKVCVVDGPFTKRQVEKYVNDIANTENVTIEQYTLVSRGNTLYDVSIIYENGATAIAKSRKVVK